jgi:hypothetical protein
MSFLLLWGLFENAMERECYAWVRTEFFKWWQVDRHHNHWCHCQWRDCVNSDNVERREASVRCSEALWTWDVRRPRYSTVARSMNFSYALLTLSMGPTFGSQRSPDLWHAQHMTPNSLLLSYILLDSSWLSLRLGGPLLPKRSRMPQSRDVIRSSDTVNSLLEIKPKVRWGDENMSLGWV